MTHTVVYHAPIDALGGQFAATMTNRQVEIGFGSKRFHFTMRSSRFHRSAKPAVSGRGGSVLWHTMGYVGCASLALGLVFVSGSMLRASPPAVGYAVVMPIGAKAAPIAPRHRARERQPARATPGTPITPIVPIVREEYWSVAPASFADDAGLGIARPDPDVATLPTVNGERAVAVYGPSRIVDGKSCRDISVFVRDVDGKVGVSPTTECKPAR